MNRRQFLKCNAIGGAAVWLASRRGWAFDQTPHGLRKFVQALPGLGPNGIPVATPDTLKYPGADYYRLSAGQFQQQFHPDLPPTTLWGYADVTAGQKVPNRRYLGGVIVAQKGRPVRLTMVNNLPPKHPLPVDTTIAGVRGMPDNRISVHLHGGLVPWNSDGGPFAWYAPDGTHGESFMNPGRNRGEADYYYPNDQSARMAWYHDHAMGITRLNAYAGLASAYIIRDPIEQALIAKGIIPSLEVPLVIQDKTFFDGQDPNYTWGNKGDLFYPYLYEANSPQSLTGRWDYGPNVTPPGAVIGPLPVPSAIPEFFSDTILVNGAAWPTLDVQRRRYRFRLLNGSQARFYNLQLYYADASGTEANLARPGPAMLQIGTEGGFLPVPVLLNNPPKQIGFDTNPNSPTFGNANRYTLLLGPGERADVIIDFSGVPAGSKLMLYNDAPAPFPMGDPLNDYYTGDPDLTGAGGAPTTQQGFGPNTRTLLQIRVPALPVLAAPMIADAAVALTPNAMGAQIAAPAPGLDLKNAVITRNLTLNEDFDEYGRLIQRLGTAVQNGVNSQGLPTWGRNYEDPVTEKVKAGAVEVWNIFNLTGDTHPMHFHLVNVVVVSRRPFNAAAWNGTPTWTGPARPADPNELGWKETVRMNPNECTTVIAKFDLPKVPFIVPTSPRTGGFEYVWHCHILEHEEHDMMRPLVVNY